MGLSEAEKTDPYWEDQVKTLPSGDHLLVKQIKAALAGDDFFYIDKEEETKVELSGVSKEVWSYYFTVFHNSEEFGLPHGKGWLDELPWTIQYLTQMRYVKRMIQIQQQKDIASGKGTSVDSINPQAFEG